MENKTLVSHSLSQDTDPPQPNTPIWHRGYSGENNPRHKLTAAQVLEIYQTTGPRRPVAHKYGVSIATVDSIRSGSRWAWLTQGGTK